MYRTWCRSSAAHARTALAVIMLISGCAEKTGEDIEDGSSDSYDGPPVSFDEALTEVLVPSCGFDSCHGSGAGYLRIHDAQTEDEWLEKESGILAGRKLVTPGQASQSYLIEKMEGAPSIEGDVMPPSGSIDGERIGMVRSWIDNIE